MPDVWTHLICGQEVLASAEDRFKKMAHSKKRLFAFGCQGPDFLFYYNFHPWAGDRRAVILGNRIHHDKCGVYFRESLKYAKKNPDSVTVVYLMALMCHWCLDRVTHPFINYISGIYRGERFGERRLINNHKRVEAAIDALLAKRMLNVDVRRVPLHPQIHMGDMLPREIVYYYHYILPLVHGEMYEMLKGTDFLNKSYRDMISALKVLHDPRGVKRAIASIYDFVSLETKNLRYYFYSTPGKGDAFLNEEKRPWCHPMDSSERYTDSFIDLFHRGVSDSIEMIKLSMRYIYGECDEEEMNEKIMDISHSTGKPDYDFRPMRHFGPVLEGED
ncbi:MAG: zinc dependent phospholipase C family protein [Bacillota bacterium]